MQDSFDYVIIGGGSSGSVIASRLAAAGASVALLEAGGTDRRLDVIVPGAVGSAYQTANWQYPVEPDPTRVNAPEAWKAGKILGGGGSINSCVYVRGNKEDFDGWAALGCDGWSYDDVLPSFKRLESWEGGANSYRGGSGPVHVMRQRDRGRANMAFYAAAQQAGFLPVDDYNAAGQEGVSIVQVNHRRGMRSQASKEYLKRVAPKNRITVITDAFASRILFEGDRAVGVEYRHEGAVKQVRAATEIVLSAGSIASPKILKLSGVGPRAELARFGIEMVANVPGVGGNLHDHPGLMQCWFSKGIKTVNKLSTADKLKGLAEYLAFGTGFLAMTVVPMQVMTTTAPDVLAPNLQIAFAPFAISRARAPNGMFDVRPTKEPGFFTSSFFLNPRSRGGVTLRSSDPSEPPVIDYHVYENPDDLRDAIVGLREVQRIMGQPAMAPLISGPMEPGASCKTEADWEHYVRAMTSPASHPVGTCKMGVDDMAVVDSHLRVRGVKGLRVVDASIMPKVTSGNTNAPSMMIGERAAEIMLNEKNAGNAQVDVPEFVTKQEFGRVTSRV